MPKNLKAYYNYVYKKPTKHKKPNIKFVACLVIIFLTLIFNNFGFLEQITQKKYIIFSKTNYYLLTLTENNSSYSNSELQFLGCATNTLNDSLILNIYSNKDVCEKVENNLNSNNLNCNTNKLTLNNIYISKQISKSVYKQLKSSLLLYKNSINNLINFCEKYDTNQATMSTIKSSVLDLKNKLYSEQKKINTNIESSLSSKTYILFEDSLNILDKILNLKDQIFSSYLKTNTINFLLNFVNIMY